MKINFDSLTAAHGRFQLHTTMREH